MTMKRLEVMRNRRFKPSTYSCSSCPETNLAFLFEGGLCTKCHNAKIALEIMLERDVAAAKKRVKAAKKAKAERRRKKPPNSAP